MILVAAYMPLRKKDGKMHIIQSSATKPRPLGRGCSSCGHKRDVLTLSDRTYHCGECGLSIDRDLNAAINLRPSTVGHTGSHACGVQIRPRSGA